jgi:hypothetical protein
MNRKLNKKSFNKYVDMIKDISEHQEIILKFSFMGFDFRLDTYKSGEKSFKVDLEYLEDNGIYYDYQEEFVFNDYEELKMYLYPVLNRYLEDLRVVLKNVMLDNVN